MEIALLFLLSINLFITGTISIVFLACAIKSHIDDELDNCTYYGEEKDRL